MEPVVCPRCKGHDVRHYTDAYVIRVPFLDENGEIVLLDDDTNEYDDCFYECLDCGYRPAEDELYPPAEVELSPEVAS